MDGSNRTLSDLVGLLKSWLPWRSEPAHVSRDFWMPDQSCRVCYECDLQFTLFNRRHHCRHCGRIFCARCTSNWVPTPPAGLETPPEEWDTVRVCNFCFRQWQLGLTGACVRKDEVRVDCQDLDNSSSSDTRYTSPKSCGSSSLTFVSMPESAGVSPIRLPFTDMNAERQSVTTGINSECALNIGGEKKSRDQFEFFPNRSDDEEEFGISRFGSTRSHFYVPFEDIDSEYNNSHKVRPDGDALDPTSMNSYSVQDSFESNTPRGALQVTEKGVEREVCNECEAPSLCSSEDVTEPVDFENSGVLWLPPEPEDEEDEKEALLFEDEDDGNAAGEWGYLRNSSSFGSGEYRSRDKSNEEHNKAMKNVVDGHFRALVAQLLQVENLLSVPEDDKENWLEIITALSWEAALLLKPDMSKSGQMDPGGYVKVKCLASGRRSQSMVVKGVVCKKNVAHRRMASKIEKPRLLILGGALEYQRVSNALSSFDTLLQQEMDHLKMAVAKIDAHHPNILLVEKSVSRYAQEYLLAKNISLVLNIKRPLLERIARCTGGQIIPSIDHLSSQKLGYCDKFHVEKFSEEHETTFRAGRKQVKTLMYFEGCPKPLGCTILLRGANGDELKKVKHVVQYGVFAAYHLALETSFLADEGASLPELSLNAPITVALPDKPNIDRSISISTIPNVTLIDSEKTPGPQFIAEPLRSYSVPSPDLLKATIASIHGNQSVETYNFQFPEKDFQYRSLPFSRDASEEKGLADLSLSLEVNSTGDGYLSSDCGDSNVNTIMKSDSLEDISKKVGVDASKQTSEEEPALNEEFLPSTSDHQSIVVSLSSRCVWKGTVCERSHMFRIKYYGNFDKPLGRFLRDHLFDQNYRCRSCDMPVEAHVQCYTHRQGSLTISVKKLAEILLPGEKYGKIWMWHRCLKCPRANGFPPATRRVVMSDAAWGLSFGKFLELSFSNHAAASRVASCGHSLHRDCLRFYGYGKMVACFRYASIDLHSVYLPLPKLDFNYERQAWIEKELNEVSGWSRLLFSEVHNALRLLVERKSDSDLLTNSVKVPESRRHLADLQGILQKEKSEFEESLWKIANRDPGKAQLTNDIAHEPRKSQPAVDILELNRLRRQLLVQSYMWDHRLIYADSLDNKTQLTDIEPTSSEFIHKPISDLENSPHVTSPVKTNETQNSSFAPALDIKPDKSPESHSELHTQRTESLFNSDPGDESSLPISIENTVTGEYNRESSNPNPNPTHRRVLSEGQAPMCLSDTLDAAWTGENHLGAGPIKYSSSNNNLSESMEADNLPAPEKKLDSENQKEDPSTSAKVSRSPSFLSSKGSESMEEAVGWLGMSFMSFYRSLNKNFLGTTEKLDTLSEYVPVYISSFRESEIRGGARLLLPIGINDTVIPIYDDEPTSIISYALLSPDYLVQLLDEPEKPKDMADSIFYMQSLDPANFHSFHSMDETLLDSYRSFGSGDEITGLPSSALSRSSLPLDPLLYTKALHARVSFADDGPHGKVKYGVTCYYAKRFEALRRLCCTSEIDFVRSLSRCKKWGAQGGKSNVFFAKTLDERFIIKQVTKTELESFIKFAPGYFKYLSESIGSRSPTCLAKILGIYQVTTKHLKGGKESKMDVLVMENLLFRRNVTRLYDLKGSSRSRYNPDSSGSNKVLLDQNLIEAMPTSPIFVGNKAKRLLERAVWNDTAFLASIDVMDYSLLVGVDEEKHELVLGIIDFMRQYTWDKHLETWVKASGILGGPKNASPTVISPKQYKRRFRKAMTTYFLMVPDQWLPPTIVPSKSQTDLNEEKYGQDANPAEIRSG
ncbi:1-phosphatidylinositol-3-phosphate 5-kinase [Striga asiatica]|uniref:1-phosphatidylinositol-3-phosphate 5-kinase n=1 Tax=Striga asiatica TaxID=4170 RepID=A0A5A7QJA8_STRAF|nr:1-phosphatidylinositol-3-phosphate 5-kinase [Striga asiatica]